MITAPRASQLRHCGRVRIVQKRSGRLRSPTKSAPVSPRNTSAKIGETIRSSALPGPRFVYCAKPVSMPKPAAMPFVQMYDETGHPHARCLGTSYATRAGSAGALP